MSSVLTVGSLFSGIGGLDYGLELTGRFRVVWQVEKKTYCRRILAKHWPDVARFSDVRTVGTQNLSPVEVLVGGFPCQDISPAGKRAGIDGPQSGLWAEFARLICELQPRYVIVENSSDLLQRGMGRVLGDLDTSGYDAQWCVLSAASVGARHLRRRTFIVAYPNRQQYDAAAQSCLDPTSGEQTPLERVYSDVAHASGDRWQTVQQEPGLLQTSQSEGVLQSPNRTRLIFSQPLSRWKLWADEPDVDRVADGVPARLDRLEGLGNAVVPQVAEYVGYCLATWHDSQVQ